MGTISGDQIRVAGLTRSWDQPWGQILGYVCVFNMCVCVSRGRGVQQGWGSVFLGLVATRGLRLGGGEGSCLYTVEACIGGGELFVQL